MRIGLIWKRGSKKYAFKDHQVVFWAVRDDQLENEKTAERREAQLEPWRIKSINGGG